MEWEPWVCEVINLSKPFVSMPWETKPTVSFLAHLFSFSLLLLLLFYFSIIVVIIWHQARKMFFLKGVSSSDPSEETERTRAGG